MKQAFIQLNDWFAKTAGRRLAQDVRLLLNDILSRHSGVHLLQCGIEEQQNWLEQSQVTHHHILTPFLSQRPHALVSSFDKGFLPFASESMHLVFLPFCLELMQDKPAFLKEVQRVLREDGRLIILGLNPYSVIGLSRHFRSKALFGCRLFNAMSLVKLSKLLGQAQFTIEQTHRFHYLPHLRLTAKMSFFFEHLGKMIWPYPSNFYIVEVKKNPRMAITPILQYGRFVIGKNN